MSVIYVSGALQGPRLASDNSTVIKLGKSPGSNRWMSCCTAIEHHQRAYAHFSVGVHVSCHPITGNDC